MKKLCFLIVLIALTIFARTAFAYEGELRDYDGIEIPKGTFIPVISSQEISTEYFDEGTSVKFISSSDLFLYETNIIPSGTEFFGYVEKINEPVVGTNGSMIIKINKLKFIDGYELPIKAYIYTPNKNIIGGEVTQPATYQKIPVYSQGFGYGYSRYVPGPSLKRGAHKVIASGADLIIILVAPLLVTHTVTN